MTRTEYVLAEMRHTYLRARLLQVEVGEIATMLKSGFITPDQAVEALHECGVTYIMCPPEEGKNG